MSKPDIVVVGSCNIDFTFYTNRLPTRGETTYGTKFISGYGGKGANQCIAATKLGATTALISRLGSDYFGKEYLSLLKRFNVNTEYVMITEGVASGVAQITVSESEGDNYILIVEGANGLLSVKDVANASDLMKHAKVALFQCEIPEKTTIAAMKLFKEKSNAILMWNPSPVPETIDESIYQLADVIVANEVESASIVKHDVKSVKEAINASQTLVEMGFQTAVVTLGADGAVFSTTDNSEPVHIKVDPISDPVDPTGAGDLFLGALAYSFIYKKELDLSGKVQFACNVARECVKKPGAQDSFPYKNDLPHLFDK